MGRPPSRDLDKFMLRLPDGMRDKINVLAEANKRTMTAEIIARLDWSFAAEEDFAKYSAETDTRSELAKQRILRANLTSRPDPIEKRFEAIEGRLDALERRK